MSPVAIAVGAVVAAGAAQSSEPVPYEIALYVTVVGLVIAVILIVWDWWTRR